jgi:hypothetical protein
VGVPEEGVKRTPLKRKTRLTSKAKPKPRKRIKAKPRGSIEFQRIYGSKRRVAFVAALPCIVCHRTPCENAHIISGGMGRKADYTDIVPLCPSCHRLQHQKGWTALGLNALTLKEWALWTQWKWATRPAE